MFFFTHQAKIKIPCRVKLIPWNVLNLSHHYNFVVSKESMQVTILYNYFRVTLWYMNSCRKQLSLRQNAERKNVFSLCFLVFITISNLRFGEIVHYIYVASFLKPCEKKWISLTNFVGERRHGTVLQCWVGPNYGASVVMKLH